MDEKEQGKVNTSSILPTTPTTNTNTDRITLNINGIAYYASFEDWQKLNDFMQGLTRVHEATEELPILEATVHYIPVPEEVNPSGRIIVRTEGDKETFDKTFNA